MMVKVSATFIVINIIGKVENDMFGYFLEKNLIDNNICTKALKFSSNFFRTLALVILDEIGNHSFSFSRKPGADNTLEKKDIDFDMIKLAKKFHFGSL